MQVNSHSPGSTRVKRPRRTSDGKRPRAEQILAGRAVEAQPREPAQPELSTPKACKGLRPQRDQGTGQVTDEPSAPRIGMDTEKGSSLP